MKSTLLKGVDSVPPEALEKFTNNLTKIVSQRLTTNSEARKGYLRFSNMGTPCERKLWYEVNTPEDKEELSADVILKFLYGDIIEAFILLLAEVSGHRVEGTQDRVELEGIVGHRDAIIDGVVVDVKSASSFSYKKFAEGRLVDDDPFGYIPQLQGYLKSSENDPLVTDKTRAAFLPVDKTLGHFTLDFHEKQDWDWKEILDHKKELLSKEEVPDRAFEPEPMGKSGNMKLGMFCSYCAFKEKCYPELRTFIYSSGPVFLTETKKVPDVYEATKTDT
jgi:hypothetical protein